MKLNRAELRKIIYDFNSISNRLLQANYNDFTGVVSRFVSFIQTTPIIMDYITDCGSCEQDIAQEFQELRQSYGRSIFSLGDTDEEEVCTVFAILSHIAENSIDISFAVAAGYTSSNKYQDRVKAFNDRVVMVLIRHIESFLTKVGIDMGLDEKITYSITVTNGQAIIANDNATVTATNNIGVDATQMAALISDIKAAAQGLSAADAESLSENLEVIEEEAKSEKPRKSFIKTAINGIKAIKGTAEFAAAVAALIQFIQPLL